MKTEEIKKLEKAKVLIKFAVMTTVYLGGVAGLILDTYKNSLRSRP